MEKTGRDGVKTGVSNPDVNSVPDLVKVLAFEWFEGTFDAILDSLRPTDSVEVAKEDSEGDELELGLSDKESDSERLPIKIRDDVSDRKAVLEGEPVVETDSGKLALEV